jgi:hypothetical protein
LTSVEQRSTPVSATERAITAEPEGIGAPSVLKRILKLSAYVGAVEPSRQGVQIATVTFPRGWVLNRL